MFKVTEKAMRPASPNRNCFYCGEPVGGTHRDSCVLINRKVKVKVSFEMVINEPASWDKEFIEYAKNEASWCTDNILNDICEKADSEGCSCGFGSVEVLELTDDVFLDE